MKGKPGSQGGSGVMDRQVVARIENYALNNDYTDVDDVCDHLRRTHKEYQRKQMGPFRQMVIKAIGVIQRKGGVAKPELQLQVCCATIAPPGAQRGAPGSPPGRPIAARPPPPHRHPARLTAPPRARRPADDRGQAPGEPQPAGRRQLGRLRLGL
jgi:hypothetical protein